MSVQDHILAGLKAALSADPSGVGGAISSLISDYVPSSGARAMQEAVLQFGDQIKALGARIDAQAIDKDEFSELFLSCVRAIARSRKRAKLAAAANLLALGLVRPDDPMRIGYTELDHFARCIDNLSIGALDVLREVSKIAAQRRRPGSSPDLERMNFADVHGRLPLMDPHLIMGLLGELGAMNLVLLDGGPNVRSPDYANFPVEFTPLGRRFVEHVLDGARR